MEVFFGVVPLEGRALASDHRYVEWLSELSGFRSMMQTRRPLVRTDLEEALREDEGGYVGWMRLLAGRRGVRASELLRQILPLLEDERAAAGGVHWVARESDFALADGTGAVILRPHGVNKAVGLRCVCRALGWPEDGSGWITFGDSWNDIEMLQWSEASVAPSNATDKGARASAKTISRLDNDQGFIGERMERAMLPQSSAL